MITAGGLAGFFAAHAVWCVSDVEGLTPILAYQSGEQRHVKRLASNETPQAIEAGQRELETNPDDADDAVLIYDGLITIQDEKLDAIIVELRAYFSQDSRATLAIPYTPKSRGAFRVHKPKLLQWAACEDFEMNAFFDAFFEGVAKHEKGSAIWSAALDESR